MPASNCIPAGTSTHFRPFGWKQETLVIEKDNSLFRWCRTKSTLWRCLGRGPVNIPLIHSGHKLKKEE
jgi:hypothetical protein